MTIEVNKFNLFIGEKNMVNTPKILMTRQETAEFLSISVSLLRNMEREEEIEPIRLGSKVMYNLEYLYEWLREQQKTITLPKKGQ